MHPLTTLEPPPVDYLPPADDEHNPYAAPQSFDKPDLPVYGYIGDMPIGEPNPNVRVRFEVMGEAWSLLKDKLGTWIVMTLIAGVLGIVAYLGLALVVGVTSVAAPAGPGQQAPDEMSPLALVAFFAVLVLFYTGVAYIYAGMLRTAIKQVRGLPIEVADMFRAGDAILPVIFAIILVSLAGTLGIALCIIPGLYIYGRLSLTLPLVVDGRLKATQAIAMSWRALDGQVLMAFLFWFVMSVIRTLGVYACLVGALFTIPLYVLSYAVLYRDFFLSQPLPGASPWIEKSPMEPEF